MVDHYLPASPQTVHWGYWDAKIPPAMNIRPGDTITIDTLSGELNDLPPEGSGFTVLSDHRIVLEKGYHDIGPHILTGPVFIEGAEPGDVLEVHITAITLRQDWGWNLQLPLHGTLPEDFPEFRRLHVPIDLDRKSVKLPWGQEMACKPFFGNIGVAPPPEFGRLSSVEPRLFGGNMDNKELTAGSTVFFPVSVAGASFSVGDGHALQGDGEVCVTAIETALTGSFCIRLQKKKYRKLPMAITADALITMGFHPSLDVAAQIALRQMINILCEITGLGAQDAYTLCSIAADLRITQTVDREKGVHCVIKRENLPSQGRELNRISSFE
jgi:acetamidase/formamidase